MVIPVNVNNLDEISCKCSTHPVCFTSPPAVCGVSTTLSDNQWCMQFRATKKRGQ